MTGTAPQWCGCGDEPRHTTRVHPVTLTAAQAAQRWPATGPRLNRGECPATDADESRAWAAIFAGAERDRFTGIILGEPAADSAGVTWQAVFEYASGQPADRYMTQTGTTR